MFDFDPIHYHLRLRPDLDNFRFSGSVRMRLSPLRMSSEIRLHACDLSVHRAVLIRPSEEPPCPFRVDPEQEILTVYLPEAVSGEIELAVDFEGRINNRMAGLYRSSYRVEEEIRWIAVTQFQESDARRVFPCVDHPAKKAVFDIELTVAEHLTAISNTPEKKVEFPTKGERTVCFETTPKMSTYLLFLGIGEFETLRDDSDTRVRAVTVPGRSRFADFALAFSKEALSYCESYFAIDYPLAKLDLIAVPDFAFGAMENWGAITFRENLLLRYPENTSRSGIERICEVAAHEIVHQWFGNLVTPADWRYLWLNESFATYFSFTVVNRFRPEWRIWDRFIGGQTAEALERDGLVETFPIEIPGGEHVVINSSTAPIIYSKGGSILRQVEGFIGEEAFRGGLRRYLSEYAYGNTHSRDLWESLESVCEQPITRMMKSWIEQPGYPLLAVSRENNRLQLRQERFCYQPHESEATWLLPVTIRLFGPDGTGQTLKLLMHGREESIDIDSSTETFKVNDGQTGFYRVRYRDPDNLSRLGALVEKKAMAAADRWGLATDLYALLKAGRVELNTYLSFLEHYRGETRLLPLGQIASNLHHLLLVLENDARERVRNFSAAFFRDLLSAIGFLPAKDEPHDRSILRDQLFWPASLAGEEGVQSFGAEQFDALLAGGTVDPEIFRGVIQIGAMTRDEAAFSWFMARLDESEDEHERMAVSAALGCFCREAQIRSALEAVLDALPDRNKFIPVVVMAANPHAIPLLWPWYVEHRAEIEGFHPLLYERVVAALIPACGIDRRREVRDYFDDHLKRTSLAADAIKMAAERLRIDLALRQRCAEAQ